jgi:ABC-type branched-subunit amino acid transport system ATPase component/ABC-type branched-subunit amino acid transport system permease subunit
MNEFLQFAVLGLGVAAVYTLLAQGVVLIYQGSGVVNFAQGALALAGAIVFTELRAHGTGVVLSLLAAIAVGALLGLVVQNAIMRPLRNAASIVRIIATLGVLIVVQAAAALHYGATITSVTQFLPQHATKVLGIHAQSDRLILFGIAVAVTVALSLLHRFTLFGVAMRAAAENELAAGTLGWSTNRLASANWALGGALAGAAGALIVPLTGLAVASIVFLVVPALAAALLGRFDSFFGTLLGATVIGVGQSLIQRYWQQPGATDALPFVVIILVLVVTGQSLPVRGHVNERLPSLGRGVLRPAPILVAGLIGIVLMAFVFSTSWQDAFSVSLSVGIVLLSIVVLTGYAGQISLAQFAMAGLGAFVAGRLVATQDWPFWIAALAGIVAAVPIGIAFALPAIRTRGVNLAVVTLGLGVAVSALLFSNSDYTGGIQGTQVGATKLLGLEIDSINHPDRWGVFVLVLFILAALAVANLRRSTVGRRLIAIRENERAAASLGVSVVQAKLYAFAVASALAALGGVVIGFRQTAIVFSSFDPVQSINAVSLGVIGGLGYVVGPLAGSTLASGGIGTLLEPLLGGIDRYLVLISGAFVVIILILNPDGMVSGTLENARRLGARLRPGPARRPSWWWSGRANDLVALTATPQEQIRVAAQAFELRGLTVRFGETVAVDDVGFAVAPGEIVGLIGPNGAGKTTLIDAVTGFVTPSAGTIRLGGHDLTKRQAHRRVRAGLARSWQSLELFEDISVLENLQIASESAQRSWTHGARALVAPGRPRLTATARAAIAEFDLGADLERKPSELSFGRRRAVGIARAAALNPSLLLLDEPAAGLSEHESRELAVLIKQLAERWGMAIIIVEHDIDMVMALCDRIVVLEFGRQIAEGTPAEIRNDPKVVAAYLGAAEPVEVRAGLGS